MADITGLLNYYSQLLIIQYNGQPKAQATIKLLAATLLQNGITLDVQQAYNVDTAVGVQLDVLGKYVGVDRYFSQLELMDYFSFVGYSEAAGLPDSPPRFGMGEYATFSDYNYNGTLIYSSIVDSQNALSDDDFRILVRLGIVIDHMNYSHAQIDGLIFSLFGDTIRPESSGNMAMQYFISGALSTLIQAILVKHLLPKPMGVRLQAVTGITGEMFALTNYAGDESPYGYGFSTYADYDTLAGEVLTYSQISEV